MNVWVYITGFVIVWNIEHQLLFTSRHNVYSETGDVNDDGVLNELPTASQFSTSCGCLTTTVTTTDIDPETTSTTESGSAACNDGGSFTITSTVLPDVDGCYSDTGDVSENEAVYSETGTDNLGQNAVVAVNFGDDSAQDVSAKPELLHTTQHSKASCQS